MIKTSVIIMLMFAISFSQFVWAESDEKLSFASSIEETLGHFWAIERNLDDNNAELALVHATHPIAELYDLMKPELVEANPEFDSTVKQALLELGQKTGKDVTRDDAQMAIDQARDIVEEARTLVVGEDLSKDPSFRLKLMKNLLETSYAEYEEAVANGIIEEMAEFQDGSAFVWRSQQIFDEIKPELPQEEAEEIDEFYEDLWDAYDKRADPQQVTTIANGIIKEIEEILGEESGEEKDLLVYVENIREMLAEVKTEYANGNTDNAISLATKAYLDNYEFLEAPLDNAGQGELMEEVEVMLREELRDLMKNNAPQEEVDAKVDQILAKMDTIATVVPEFGPAALIILVTAIVGIVVFAKSRNITPLAKV